VSDFQFTAAAFTVVLTACHCIVCLMVAFHYRVKERRQWLQESLAKRDRELQR
jgi:heme exporter protein D